MPRWMLMQLECQIILMMINHQLVFLEWTRVVSITHLKIAVMTVLRAARVTLHSLSDILVPSVLRTRTNNLRKVNKIDLDVKTYFLESLMNLSDVLNLWS